MLTCRLMPESALTAPKEKKLTGRQWFESGRAIAVSNFFFLCAKLIGKKPKCNISFMEPFSFFCQKGATAVAEGSEEDDEEDIDFDDDFEGDALELT